MRTIKFIFAIALIALATKAFSQRSFSSQDTKEELIKVRYALENSKISNKVGDIMDKFSRSESRLMEEPVVCMSFVMDQPEIVYEEVYNVESWMTKPFHCNYAEPDLRVESWMTTPFGLSESIEVESWMSVAWL